jgi:hypothetical protein
LKTEGAVVWHKVVIECSGVPREVGAQGATDITADFKKRHWHRNAECRWDGNRLILSVENDFDPQGLALMDEFSDEISACIREGFDGDLRLVSSTEVAP